MKDAILRSLLEEHKVARDKLILDALKRLNDTTLHYLEILEW